MLKFSQKGTIPIFVLIAFIGLIAFLVLTFSFKDLKPSKAAGSNTVFFSDDVKSGKIDIFDYNQLLADFGKTASISSDIVGNGKVDIFDYNQLLADFGKTSTHTIIYDEGLNTGWENWSDGITPNNLADTTKLYSGTRNARFSFAGPWGVFTMHHNGFNTTGYDTLTFALQATQASNPNLAIIVSDGSGQLIKSSLTNFGGQPTVGSYKVYKIPLSSLNAFGKTITNISFHEFSGSNYTTTAPSAQIYLDTVALINMGLSSPTPSPSSIPSSSPTSSPPPQGTLLQYPFNYTLSPAQFASAVPFTKDGLDKREADCAATIADAKRRGVLEYQGIEHRPINANNGVNQRIAKNGYTLKDNTPIPPFTAESAKNAHPEMKSYAEKLTGNFTGTTDEILQWAACKYGMDINKVRAQTTNESWWFQGALGDCNQGSDYPNIVGSCPSVGVLQIKAAKLDKDPPPNYDPGYWPYVLDSLAFNAEYTQSMQRACIDGKLSWLVTGDFNTVSLDEKHWGCIGMWFSGQWKDQAALDYINQVKTYHYNRRSWDTSEFTSAICGTGIVGADGHCVYR